MLGPRLSTLTLLAWVALISCSKSARLSLYPPPGATVAALETAGPAAISPDGSRLAFVAVDETGTSQLWVRPVDRSPAHPLAATANATYPFWSPGSRDLAFFADGQLKRISASGGAPRVLCPALDARGGSWGKAPDGAETIIFAAGASSALSQVPAAGGNPAPLTSLDTGRDETSHRLPQFLPDGRHFLYLAISNSADNTGIFADEIGAAHTRRLMSSDAQASYAPPGYLLYASAGNLMARPFDSARLAFTGEPLLAGRDVAQAVNSHASDFSISATGLLAWREQPASQRQLAWFDRKGRQIPGMGAGEPYFNPALSPDGRRIALSRLDSLAPPAGHLWLVDPASGSGSRLTSESGAQLLPAWSPDGRRIVYGLMKPPDFGLYLANTGGGTELLLKTSHPAVPMDWSRDGRFILFAQLDPKTKWDLWVLPLDGYQQPAPVVQTEFNEGDGRFSPDGRWIAFWSDQSGRYEVYVSPFRPGRRANRVEQWQVSTAGGTWPRWRQDGRELFFKSLDNRIISVPLQPGSAFYAGVPVALFSTDDLEPDNFTYDVSPDGQRFLISRMLETGPPRPINVTPNWLAAAKR